MTDLAGGQLERDLAAILDLDRAIDPPPPRAKRSKTVLAIGGLLLMSAATLAIVARPSRDAPPANTPAAAGGRHRTAAITAPAPRLTYEPDMIDAAPPAPEASSRTSARRVVERQRPRIAKLPTRLATSSPVRAAPSRTASGPSTTPDRTSAPLASAATTFAAAQPVARPITAVPSPEDRAPPQAIATPDVDLKAVRRKIDSIDAIRLLRRQ